MENYLNKPIIRASTFEDILELGRTMSQTDKDELRHQGLEPHKALIESIRNSYTTCTIEREGRVVVMFGVGGKHGEPGVPWMLCTDEVRKITSLAREAREIVQLMLRRHGYLANYVWSQNKAHIRWIKWLGFHFNGSTIEVNGEIFLWFELLDRP